MLVIYSFIIIYSYFFGDIFSFFQSFICEALQHLFPQMKMHYKNSIYYYYYYYYYYKLDKILLLTYYCYKIDNTIYVSFCAGTLKVTSL